MASVSEIWRSHRILLIALGLSLLVTAFFGLRLARHASHWQPDMPLQGWMTLGQVAHINDVPRDDLALAVGIEPDAQLRLTLGEIAQRTGKTLPEVEQVLAEAIAKAQAEQGTPEPGS